MTMPLTKRLFRLALLVGALLLVPLVAMQFSRQVNWDWFDFLVAGVLLFGTGLLYELFASKGGTTAYRLAMSLTLATALFLVWSNLAVGIIGNENNPANLLYGGVLAVGFVGAMLARLRPQGMARTLLATALAQLLVPVVALLIWPQPPAGGSAKVLGANTLFVALWVGAALLFRRADATRQARA